MKKVRCSVFFSISEFFATSESILSRNAMSAFCRERINFIKKRIHTTTQELPTILPKSMLISLHGFLEQRASCVRNTIHQRREKKLDQMRKDYNQYTNIDRSNWVINLSKKPLTIAECSLLEKGPKFSITPNRIPYKNISEVEAAIQKLPDETKDIIRMNTASILDRACFPQHMNISTTERKALSNLKKDPTRIVTKADKGNSLVIMDQSDYDSKMTNLLQDKTTFTIACKAPFKKVERELNAMLLDLKNKKNSLRKPIVSYTRVMQFHHPSKDPSTTTKSTIPLDLLSPPSILPYTTLPNFFLKFFLLYKTRIVFQ